MTIQTLTRQFTQTNNNLPVGELTDRPDHAVAQALASGASRSLKIKTHLKAGSKFGTRG